MNRTLYQGKIYGTPWKGSGAEFYQNDSSTLKKIIFIKHGLINSLERISNAESTKQILMQSFPFFWDKKNTLKVFSLIQELLKSIEVYEIVLLPDKSIIPLIDELVNCE